MIKLIITDVDGTLTDGGIYYGTDGMEIKEFNARDAAGLFACQALGIECMILTGRKSEAVERRGKDLHFAYVVQGVQDKGTWLSEYMAAHKLKREDVLYIGDDLNDIAAMKLCGLVGCPADALPEVLSRADFVAAHDGGHGAVRDVLFAYLKREGLYAQALTKAYGGI